MIFEIEEEERQALLLAIAKLSIARPGWYPGLLRPLAEKLHGLEMFENFLALERWAQMLAPVVFTHGDGVFQTQWQVTLNEDGTLLVLACGRRCGRILVEPSSHTTVRITSDKLVKGDA